MKQQYETPFLEIEWFDLADVIAYSNGRTDYIPDTDYDDIFGDE